MKKVVSLLCLLGILFTCVSCSVPEEEPEDMTPQKAEETTKPIEEELSTSDEILSKLYVGMNYSEVRELLEDRYDPIYSTFIHNFFLEDGRKFRIECSSSFDIVTGNHDTIISSIDVYNVREILDERLAQIKLGQDTVESIRKQLVVVTNSGHGLKVSAYNTKSEKSARILLEDGRVLFAYYTGEESESDANYPVEMKEGIVYKIEVYSYLELRKQVDLLIEKVEYGMTLAEISELFGNIPYKVFESGNCVSFLLKDGRYLHVSIPNVGDNLTNLDDLECLSFETFVYNLEEHLYRILKNVYEPD